MQSKMVLHIKNLHILADLFKFWKTKSAYSINTENPHMAWSSILISLVLKVVVIH